MKIVASCAQCATRFRIDERAAGRRVKCRRCGSPVRIPLAATGATPAGQRLSPATATLPPRRTRKAASRAARPAEDSAGDGRWLDPDRPYLWIAAPVVSLAVVLLATLVHERTGTAVYLTLTGLTAVVVVGAVLMLLGRAFQDSVAQALLSLVVPVYLLYWTGTEWYQARRPAQALGLALLCHAVINGVNVALLLCVFLPIYGLLTGSGIMLVLLAR